MDMNRIRVLGRGVAFGVALAGMLAMPTSFAGKPPPTSTATLNTYAGRATVLGASVNALGIPVALTVSDTGELDPTGGMRDAHFAALSTPQPLQVDLGLASAVTVGSGDRTDSTAALLGLDLDISAGLVKVAASVVTSNALAICAGGSATYSGSSTIADLVINNSSINVTGAPNQTISLLGGLARVIINEQKFENGRQIVNGLHVIVGTSLVTADVVVSHADAGISCGSTSGCPVKDFVTGGGFITRPDGSKANFGFVGGQKANGLQGHLQYNDHSATGPTISGSSVSSYSGQDSGTTARTVVYGCKVDGVASSCTLSVADMAEPGKGIDEFALSGGGYSASGPKITQGNIQLHKPKCATTATAPPKGRK